jgi:SanA protein
MRTSYKLIILVLLVLIATTIWADHIITNSSTSFIKENTNDLPSLKTGLLLGTSRTLKSGKPNEYFYNRTLATAELYKASKIKYIIISGDNSEKDYNEPLDMKNELIKNGVPDSVIYLDFAGFRTFDSVIRAKEIFGQTSFIVISQKFHNQRAIYLARQFGIEAYGYNAKDVNVYSGFKTKFREYFARMKVFIDIYCGTTPKFLGDKIVIGK